MSPIYGQYNSLIKLEILGNSYIKEKKQDALKLRVKVSFDSTQIDSIVLKNFNYLVPSSPFIYDSLSLNECLYSSIGLIYIIEDKNGNIINAVENLPPSYKNINDEIKYAEIIKTIDTSTLRFIEKSKDNIKFKLSSVIIKSKNQEIYLFPKLNEYHNLKKGEYKIYLIYSFYEDLKMNKFLIESKELIHNERKLIFNGSLKSNKVDFFIK